MGPVHVCCWVTVGDGLLLNVMIELHSRGLGNTSEPIVSGRLSSRPLATQALMSFHNDLVLPCVAHVRGDLAGLISPQSSGISGETDAS